MKKFKLDKKCLIGSIKTGLATTVMSGITTLGAGVGSHTSPEKLIQLAVFSIGLGVVSVPSYYFILRDRNNKEEISIQKKKTPQRY